MTHKPAQTFTAPPGWLYDPDEKVWLYSHAPWSGRLVWLKPEFGMGAQWRYTFHHADGFQTGGGIAGNWTRERVMRQVMEMVEECWEEYRGRVTAR